MWRWPHLRRSCLYECISITFFSPVSELTPSSEPDLSLFVNPGWGALVACGPLRGAGAGFDFSFSEFSDAFALTFGGGDCVVRVSSFSFCDGADVPSEVCTFRVAGGKPCVGGVGFFDLPNRNDMLARRMRSGINVLSQDQRLGLEAQMATSGSTTCGRTTRRQTSGRSRIV